MKIWQLALCKEENIYRALYTCTAYGEVAFVTLQATYECHCIYLLCVFLFEAEHVDRRFPSNCLFMQAVILSICFLKLFVYTCRVSCSNTAVACVDSALWRLPLCSTTSSSAVSSSAPCTFLIQHLWVVSWLASPETWMRVRLDLSWLGTFPPREFSVSEVTLVDKVYCRVFCLRVWLSVFHFTSVASLDILICGLLFLDDWICFCCFCFCRVHCATSSFFKNHLGGAQKVCIYRWADQHHTVCLIYNMSLHPKLMCVSPCKPKCCFRTWPWCCFAWGWWALSFPGSWSPSCPWGPSSASSNVSPGQTLITHSYIAIGIEPEIQADCTLHFISLQAIWSVWSVTCD